MSQKLKQIKKTLGLSNSEKQNNDQSEYTTKENLNLDKELWELKRHLTDAKKEV